MSLALDFSADFAVFDNQQAVTLGGVEVSAIRRWVSKREAEASGGKFTTEDVVWHLSGVSLTLPAVGAVLTDGQTAWVILAIRTERLTNRVELICRLLAVTQTVTIQRATLTKDANGIQSSIWTNETTGVSAAIVLVSGSDTEELKLQQVKPRYRISVDRSFETRNRRIVHGDAIYRIVGHSATDQIGDLFHLDCEEW